MLTAVFIAWIACADDLSARIDRLARPLVESGTVVGFSLGVISAGEEVMVRGYGRIAHDRDVEPDGDTLYEIGSVSKVFTALLAADAAQRGEWSLDDAVNDHLPEDARLDDIDPDDPVRLWHLASHVSGLPRMPTVFTPGDPNNPYVDYGVDDLFEALPTTRLNDSPGDRYAYSNLAAGLLGTLVTRVAEAESYEGLLRARVCEPLGLNDTMLTLDDAHRARFAAAHDADGRSQYAWDFDALAGAGAIRSTVRDLLRFARAELAPDSTPLGPAIIETRAIRHDLPGGGGVALGWHVSQIDVLWHNGQTGGYHAFLACDYEQNHAVALLSNTSGGVIDALGDRLVRLLRGGEPDPVPVRAAVPLDPQRLERYVGTYRMNLLARFDITLEDGHLLARLTGQPAFRIHPTSATEFFYRVVDASITFELGEDEVPVALTLHQNGQDMRCEREADEGS